MNLGQPRTVQLRREQQQQQPLKEQMPTTTTYEDEGAVVADYVEELVDEQQETETLTEAQLNSVLQNLQPQQQQQQQQHFYRTTTIPVQRYKQPIITTTATTSLPTTTTAATAATATVATTTTTAAIEMREFNSAFLLQTVYSFLAVSHFTAGVYFFLLPNNVFAFFNDLGRRYAIATATAATAFPPSPYYNFNENQVFVSLAFGYMLLTAYLCYQLATLKFAPFLSASPLLHNEGPAHAAEVVERSLVYGKLATCASCLWLYSATQPYFVYLVVALLDGLFVLFTLVSSSLFAPIGSIQQQQLRVNNNNNNSIRFRQM